MTKFERVERAILAGCRTSTEIALAIDHDEHRVNAIIWQLIKVGRVVRGPTMREDTGKGIRHRRFYELAPARKQRFGGAA
jgi:hypothetical protein